MRDTFLTSGEVGRDLLAVDWEATPLGAPESWSSSLQAAVRLMLASRFPMWMAWGPALTFFCNDAYRRDTLGKKYPWALGRPASEVWSEVWADVEGRIHDVLRTGVATWDEKLRLFLERSGYPEETYHTFSYSPLADDDGAVAGMLCVVSEDTEEVIAARRLQTLRDLGRREPGSPTVAETVVRACSELARSDLDLPFTLVYLYDEDGSTARLAGWSGFGDAEQPGEHVGVPRVIDLREGSGPWPRPTTAGVATADLDLLGGEWPTGGWSRPARSAAVVSLAQGTQATPYGFLVAGVNPFRVLDQSYADFLELVANQLAVAIADARAFELEQLRAETLARLDRAKTDFFTNVSHEFRTPLTLLLGPVEDALSDGDDPLPERQRRRLEAVHRNAQRLLKLVNTLLDFSRLESGRVTGTFEPVDLAHYTRELASMFDTAADRLGLTLTVDCPPLPGPVHVDRDLWAKVVLNLLSNAFKFTLEGEVTITLRADEDHAVLAVSDTGVGIPEHEQERLFERFHRVAGGASRTHEGSGIGLALVAELTQLHGGAVTVTSAPYEGSTFRVSVPFGTAHLPPDRVVDSPTAGVARQVVDGFLAEVAQLVPAEAPAASDGQPEEERPLVLVVDDNADLRTYVSDLLRPTYTVVTAVDGAEGLRLARANPPDLVLTDVMMPRLDGFGLLAALREEPATVDVPVVMLSARAGEDGTLEGLEAGADDYLVKPFSARELQARVRSNLELDRARRTREQLERSQALLDQAQRLAHLGSWEVHLASGRIRTTPELRRILGLSAEQADDLRYPEAMEELVHPEDRPAVQAALAGAVPGQDVHYETRIRRGDGTEVLVSVHAEVVPGPDGQPALLRGSVQDISDRRLAEEALARAQAGAEAAAREHAIADELQRSLLPALAFDLEHLEVATYYRAGVEGTQVGGDWYDVIELGAGRTALVVGDVMGRGVQAAAVMGQLRSAVRAYARLDLPPADLLEYLDGIVRDLGDDHIVTCLYAVFDPADLTLRYANAGHLPPLVVDPETGVTLLTGSEEPPLGVGPYNLHQQEVRLAPGATVVLYTDGLVERRGEDLDEGLESLRALSSSLTGPLHEVPEALVSARLPEGPDDDVAVLVARVDVPESSHGLHHVYESSEEAVADARHRVADHLRDVGVNGSVLDDAVLLTSELVTNAVLHAAPPVELRLAGDDQELRIEVHDRASYEPRKRRPAPDDEHGRGLQIVAAVADRWGTRPTDAGKAVWCVLPTTR